jgi:hypothetical protein
MTKPKTAPKPRMYEVHPIADLMPAMMPLEYQALLASVRADGVRQPVVLYHGKILDGRHRYRAAIEAGVGCTFEVYSGMDPYGEALLRNTRRHMKLSQRAMAAARFLNQGAKARSVLITHFAIDAVSLDRACLLLKSCAQSLIAAVDGGALSLTSAMQQLGALPTIKLAQTVVTEETIISDFQRALSKWVAAWPTDRQRLSSAIRREVECAGL